MTRFHRTAQTGPDQNTKKWEATVQQRKKSDTSSPAFKASQNQEQLQGTKF